ncbi:MULTISPECIES: hypothetical protein [Burkholderia cepacia complex]|uniref:hypothetical protein n=1 Tax=Burkholderia cepacia complex TaxID=87882 RepID=UPI0013DE03C3|nr:MULTISPECIES: hypothetical protein [Burkholderia cepacia complex]
MNERQIIVSDLPGRPKLVLDKMTGNLTPVQGEVLPLRGSFVVVHGNKFCMYAEGAHLYLQQGARRWEITNDAAITYSHDFDLKTTTFGIGDLRIEYEAWWADDPNFNKFAPESDENYDFLAYVFELSQDDDRRRDLIQRWSAA